MADDTVITPTRIEGYSPTEMLLEWNTGEKFALPYLELRFECPCAVCVDEHTGKRLLKRDSLRPDVKPLTAQVIGRYAVQFTWSDGHDSGIFTLEHLRALCQCPACQKKL